jgi:glutaminase
MRNVLAPLEANEAFVSTGQLPDPQKVTAIVTEAYEHFRSNRDGRNSNVYPALQRVGSNLFGVCVVATGGNVFAVGDTDYEFAIMSVSKPFVFALVCQSFGADEIRRKVGANATGCHSTHSPLSRGAHPA